MNTRKLPKTTLESPTGDITLTWIRTSDLHKYKPYFQVYGVVFNNKDEVLVIQEKGKWKIPGGTPEKGETDLETLERELIEEADVAISEAVPLGVQRVDYPNNPNKEDGDLYYQYRYICLLDRLLDQTLDPATGIINPRMFVPANKVTEYIKWGEVGKAMFEDAKTLYQEKWGHLAKA
jgi:8-oxo-dGTP pyrophosphatase MutT (NUDIX family)